MGIWTYKDWVLKFPSPPLPHTPRAKIELKCPTQVLDLCSLTFLEKAQ